MKDSILSADNPQRKAAELFITEFGITDWNQETHARFLLWTALKLEQFDPSTAAGKAFAAMLLSHGMAGNASQFGQSLCKPAGKHVLGGLLASRSKASAAGLDDLLASLAG